MNFSELQIQPEIVNALKEDNIEQPTLIQERAIPLIKQGRDLIGMSKTGSGKTAAFAVPILEKVNPQDGLQVLIIAPVRELAVQICGELNKFGKYLKFNTATIYGGVAINPQMEKLTRANIVVGTPGRLLDHLQRGTLDLSKIKSVVLDEADKMVEMGFIEDITAILDKTPKNRQVLLFGATLSSEIDHLKRKYMNQPVVAEAEKRVKEDFLEQYYYNVMMNQKFSLLVHLLKKEDTERVLIFCSARSTVELVSKNLKMQGLKVDMIHGKMMQNKRLRIIENFHKKDSGILVASAVAARGLHIEGVSHVINYDLSQDPQEYVHRVGRTARAGEKGKAITLLSDKDYEAFGQILERYGLDVQELPLEKFPRLNFDARPSRPRNGFRGGNGHQRSNFRSHNGYRSSGQGNGYRSNGYQRSAPVSEGFGAHRSSFGRRRN